MRHAFIIKKVYGGWHCGWNVVKLALLAWVSLDYVVLFVVVLSRLKAEKAV